MSMYSESNIKRDRFLVGLGVTACLLMGVATSAAPPHYADEPLPRPQFTIDADTPLSALLGSATVLEQGDPEGDNPIVVYSETDLGLTPFDDLDALSYNREDVASAGQVFLLLFDVDRDTVGQALPDPVLVANNQVFSVPDQAAKNQAAGDLFLTLDGFDRAGNVVHDGTRTEHSNNTVAVNQGDTGGVDRNLSPEKSASQASTGTEDNSNGSAYPSGTTRGSRNGRLFFSLTSDSFSTGDSGANVFMDSEPSQPGKDGLYAQASDLQLQLADDINALVVMDVLDDEFFGPGDKLLFSLAPGSPSLGSFDAATIFSFSFGAPSIEVFAFSDQLGLGDVDDSVDALEVVPVLPPEPGPWTPFDEAMSHAIFAVWPDDCDSDADFWPPVGCECTTFSDCYDPMGIPFDCEIFDMDFDDDIDCNDWHEYKLVYADVTLGSPCIPLTVEAFVAALLGSPFLPGDICLADMNDDMQLTGRDVRSYIDAVLHP